VYANVGAQFEVGAARTVFAASAGKPMAGYALRSAPALGTHDDLHVRALVISDGTHTICLLVLEILSVSAALAARIRAHIYERIHLSDVMVAATHTHSAPTGLMRFAPDPGSEQYMGVYDAELVDQLVETCGDAAAYAYQLRRQARALMGIASAQGVAANRLDANGIYDPDIPWLVFVDATGTIFAGVYSLACHPTVLGADNLLYSGDLTGALSCLLETRWSGAFILGLTGAAGNISTRFTRAASTFTEVERLAARAAETFDPSLGILMLQGGVSAAHTTLDVLLKPSPDADDLHTQLQTIETALAANPAQLAPLLAHAMSLRLALKSPRRSITYLTTEIQAIGIGEALLISFPGEMFVEFGLSIRAQLQPTHTLIAGYTNDYLGYIPVHDTPDGYEAVMAVVAPDTGQRLLDTALALIRDNSLHAEQ
jgi:neutral/alkaline ceramidase-like enzyme